MKSPTSALPNPVDLGPGSRTSTAVRTGRFAIPVRLVVLYALGCGCPTFTESRKATGTGYGVSGR